MKLALKKVQKCKVSICRLQYRLAYKSFTLVGLIYPIRGRNLKSVRVRIATGPNLRHHHPGWGKLTTWENCHVIISYNQTSAIVLVYSSNSRQTSEMDIHVIEKRRSILTASPKCSPRTPISCQKEVMFEEVFTHRH